MIYNNLILTLQWYITIYSMVIFLGFLFFMMILGLYYYSFSTFTHFSRQDIPHKKRLPYFGTMGLLKMLWKPYPEYVLEVYKKLKDLQYGVLYTFQRPMVVLIDPELIGNITTRDFEYFVDRRPVFIENQGADWKLGLPHLKGPYWKETRRALHPVFTPKNVRKMFEKMTVCCKQVLKDLKDKVDLHDGWISQDGECPSIEMKNVFTRYSCDVVACTTLGIQVNSLEDPNNEFITMAKSATSFDDLSGIRWLLYMTGPKIMMDLGIKLIPTKVSEFFKSRIMNIFPKYGAENFPENIAKQFIKVNRLKDSPTMTEENVLAQFLTFLLSAFDTTSTLLCFASYELARNPEIQIKLQIEVDDVFQHSEITYDVIKGMKYLDMVISETLRLHPPAVSTDRICVRRYGLDAEPGMELRPGDHVLIPIYGLHRDPRNFPEPERFDPERFSNENRQKIKPFTYLPFGMGPRGCLGADYAKMQVKLMLFYFLSFFNFKMSSRTPVPLKLVHTGFNLTADEGFCLGIEKRDDHEYE